ncbi:exocyst complex component SEC10a-like [Glycine soja]|uniref:exocyst complex component SEC10a-like n=1 Tax=Glycine soja TaxID=3848 RepID=UPI00103A5968|nr:exocyst complex component SEC10a-like [Glycine soja]
MSPFEMQDILLPSGTNGVKDLHISASHSSSLALFASLGKKLSVLSLDSGNLVVNYDLQFNRGKSAMQHYVAARPMFIDVEIMNADTKLVLGDQAAQASPSNVVRGLSSLYKEITDIVRKEVATITTIFPSPSEVMSILVQRVIEQRITALLDKLLEKPSLVNLPSVEEAWLLLCLGMLAMAYEKTQELARDLQAVGCGDLDVDGVM